MAKKKLIDTNTLQTFWNGFKDKLHIHSNKTVLDNTTASYTKQEKDKIKNLSTVATSGNYNDLTDIPNEFPASSITVGGLADNLQTELSNLEMGIGTAINIGSSKLSYIEKTKEEYDALSESEKNNGQLYFITDAPSGATMIKYASDIKTNDGSNVQDKLDETNNTVSDIYDALNTNHTLTNGSFRINWNYTGDFNDASCGIFSGYGCANSPNSKAWCTVVSLPANGSSLYNTQLCVIQGVAGIYRRACSGDKTSWSAWILIS